MLASRYRYDGKPVEKLNDFQRSVKREIEEKIASGIYVFEGVRCAACGGEKFENVSEKDRYGLYVPVVVCTSCGLVQTNPRMTKASYERFYNEDYRRLYRGVSGPTESFFREQYLHGSGIVECLRQRDRLPEASENTLVLEVGCGAGGILQRFRDEGFAVKGVDLDVGYLSYGRDRYGLDLIQGTLTDFGSDLRADLIVYSHVLEHVTDPVAELRNAKDFLTPKGTLYIEVPGIKNLVLSDYRADFLAYLQNAHLYHFTLTTLRNVSESAGLMLVAGDEVVRAVFETASSDSGHVEIVNDRKAVVDYLIRTERLRPFLIVSPYTIKRFLFRLQASQSMHWIKRLLQSVGLYRLISRVYWRVLRMMSGNQS